MLRCTWPVAEALLYADGDNDNLCVKLRNAGADANTIIADAFEARILLSKEQVAEAERFYGPWTWGPISQTLVFGYQDDSFADRATETATRREREVADIDLLPGADGPIHELPPAPEDALAGLLRRRRSRRVFDSKPMDQALLASCLQAGFGVTGERIADNGRVLPLTAAPSSGALNTYDAWVLSREVRGLEAGTYRYLPQERGLNRQRGIPVAFDQLFGGQSWAARASCAIVFMADLRRQASKYSYPTTIPAVFIEAGARAELLLLEAEQAALSAVLVGLAGVGAFDRDLASQAGIWGETSMVIPTCAILLGGGGGTIEKH